MQILNLMRDRMGSQCSLERITIQQIKYHKAKTSLSKKDHVDPLSKADQVNYINHDEEGRVGGLKKLCVFSKSD